MELLSGSAVGPLPMATQLLPEPLLQRQVLLRTTDELHTPFVYAASWWNADSVGQYLQVGGVCYVV